MAKLTIVRGLPGSGKSTYAKSLGCFHVEADMFFIIDGEYKWRQTGDNHKWCFNQVKMAMENRIDVVVSNTFTQKWELEKYVDLSKEFCYIIEVVSCQGSYGNTHDVPEETLAKMKERWEKYDRETEIL